MTIYLVSTNLLVDNLDYLDGNLDYIRSIRPLSTIGERRMKEVSNNLEFSDTESIYASYYAGSVASSKYLAEKYSLPIILEKRLNDCKVGSLNGKSMKMIKGLQEHDFNYKMPNGESLNEVGNKMDAVIHDIVRKDENAVIFTHRRTILGYFLKFAKVGYNLDDELILEYNGKVIYSNIDGEVQIYKLTFDNRKLSEVEIIEI